MKTLIKDNGFEYTTSHRFGNPKQYLNEFQFLLSFDLETGVVDFTEEISYRITDDNYLQLCRLTNSYNDHSIVAQWELSKGSMKEQLHTLVRDYFVGLLLFVGYPCKLNNSLVFSEADFRLLVQEAEKENDRLKLKTKNNKTV